MNQQFSKETVMSDYDTLFPSPGEGMYDLGVGAPSKEDLLAVSKSVFAPSVAAAKLDGTLDDGREGTFQYGPTRGPYGYLRRLREFLQTGYTSQMAPVRQECLLATAGATSGLWLCATEFLRSDAVVFVESPTYFVALQVLKRDLGHRIVPVPMADDGIDLDALTTLIAREKKAFSSNEKAGDGKRFWAMLYSIPTFHNPTGVVLSPEKSRRLVEMAKMSDFLVMCDDVYNLLNYDSKPPPERLLAYDLCQEGEDDLGHVVSNGSFSKLVGPGWRLGWLEASQAMIRRLGDGSGILRSGGCMNQLSATLVAAGLEQGAVGKHVDSLKTNYGERMAAVYQILSRDLPTGFKVNLPQGGYFLWISSSGYSDGAFSAAAFAKSLRENCKILILPGVTCGLEENQETLDRFFRIAITYYSKEELVQCALVICRHLKEFIAK